VPKRKQKKRPQGKTTTKQRKTKHRNGRKIKWKQFKEIINIKIIKLNYKIIFLIKNI
jgi:hypothetical protein